MLRYEVLRSLICHSSVGWFRCPHDPETSTAPTRVPHESCILLITAGIGGWLEIAGESMCRSIGPRMRMCRCLLLGGAVNTACLANSFQRRDELQGKQRHIMFDNESIFRFRVVRSRLGRGEILKSNMDIPRSVENLSDPLADRISFTSRLQCQVSMKQTWGSLRRLPRKFTTG